MDSKTGVISGIPTGSGSYTFTFTVTNAFGVTSSVTLSGTIAAAPVVNPPSSTGSGSTGTGTGSGSTGTGTGSGSTGTGTSATSGANSQDLTRVGATGVVPFSLAKVKIETGQQLAIIKGYKFKKGASVTITGFASKTSGSDDLRVSLDRALELKSALSKLHPDLIIKAVGGGVTKNPLCASYANQCAVVKVTR